MCTIYSHLLGASFFERSLNVTSRLVLELQHAHVYTNNNSLFSSELPFKYFLQYFFYKFKFKRYVGIISSKKSDGRFKLRLGKF